MPAESYSVRVTKDYLIFCCAHFITYDGRECERLHGHNYRVAVEVDGPLDENYYVFDFIALKNLARKIVDELDHHMLIALENPRLPVEVHGEQVRVTFGAKHWTFPKEDCVLLPIANTTAELLARWIAGRLRDELASRGVPETIRVEVEESIGQTAKYQWSRAG